MKQLNIIKIGGNIIDDQPSLDTFLSAFASINGKKLLVHGGGKTASDISRKLGIQPQVINGRRITDNETLDVVCMVYAGLINKKIIAALQSHHCNAIGLCGADANIITASKRKATDIDYGFAGDVDTSAINSIALSEFLSKDITPVIAPITHDGKGQLLNTNADTIAASLAIALSSYFSVNLIYCFEKAGVLRNINDPSSLIATLPLKEYEQLKQEGLVAAGMIPKLDNAFNALNLSVGNVTIGSADNIQQLITMKDYAGTRITL